MKSNEFLLFSLRITSIFITLLISILSKNISSYLSFSIVNTIILGYRRKKRPKSTRPAKWLYWDQKSDLETLTPGLFPPTIVTPLSHRYTSCHVHSIWFLHSRRYFKWSVSCSLQEGIQAHSFIIIKGITCTTSNFTNKVLPLFPSTILFIALKGNEIFQPNLPSSLTHAAQIEL